MGQVETARHHAGAVHARGEAATLGDQRMRQRRVRRMAGLVTIGLVGAIVLSGCVTRFGASLLRPQDPVVMQGASLPKLLGADPDPRGRVRLGRRSLEPSAGAGRPARPREPGPDLQPPHVRVGEAARRRRVRDPRVHAAAREPRLHVVRDLHAGRPRSAGRRQRRDQLPRFRPRPGGAREREPGRRDHVDPAGRARNRPARRRHRRLPLPVLEPGAARRREDERRHLHVLARLG